MEDKLVAGAEPTWFSGVDGNRFSRGDDWCGRGGCGLFGCRFELQCGSSPNRPASFAWWAWVSTPKIAALPVFFFFAQKSPVGIRKELNRVLML